MFVSSQILRFSQIDTWRVTSRNTKTITDIDGYSTTSLPAEGAKTSSEGWGTRRRMLLRLYNITTTFITFLERASRLWLLSLRICFSAFGRKFELYNWSTAKAENRPRELRAPTTPRTPRNVVLSNIYDNNKTLIITMIITIIILMRI